MSFNHSEQSNPIIKQEKLSKWASKEGFKATLTFLSAFFLVLILLFVLLVSIPEDTALKNSLNSQIQNFIEHIHDFFEDLFSSSHSPPINNKDFLPSEITLESQSDHDPLILMDSTQEEKGDFVSEVIENSSTQTLPLIKNNTQDSIQRSDVLKDPLHRISPGFEIPDELKMRTEFWFNIYTQYDSQVHVIHHMKYPWVIFKIIDTRQMIAQGKGPLWLRVDRAHKMVAKIKNQIERTLKKLSYRKSIQQLNKEERVLFSALQNIPGTRSRVLREAASSVRSQLGQMDFFISGLKVSSRYLPQMEEIFEQNGLPIELTRLPFVESSFNVKAQSKVGASGIWQIMPRTGRAYLNVSNTIDERNSPLKATQAAARIFRQYYRALKNWPLTLTSYNHGIGGILKAVRIVKSNHLPTIIRKYHSESFKFASSNFYTCFLAALYAERYHDHIFSQISKEEFAPQEMIQMSNPTRLKKIKELTGLDISTLLDFNLDIKKNESSNPLLPRGFKLYLPAGSNAFIKRNNLGQEWFEPVLPSKAKTKQS